MVRFKSVAMVVFAPINVIFDRTVSVVLDIIIVIDLVSRVVVIAFLD